MAKTAAYLLMIKLGCPFTTYPNRQNLSVSIYDYQDHYPKAMSTALNISGAKIMFNFIKTTIW
jgi:hypothetical protein